MSNRISNTGGFSVEWFDYPEKVPSQEPEVGDRESKE
jgi:hypothetical protein